MDIMLEMQRSDGTSARWVIHNVSLKGNKQNKKIVKLASKGDWEQAVCIWRNAADPETIYNLGALYEVKGWYPEAEETYQRAIDADAKGYAEKGLRRVQTRMTTLDDMRDGYGLPVEPVRPPENDICRAYE